MIIDLASAIIAIVAIGAAFVGGCITGYEWCKLRYHPDRQLRDTHGRFAKTTKLKDADSVTVL